MDISYETLFVGIVTFVLIVATVRASKIRIKDAVFWILWTLILAVFAFAPVVQGWVKKIFGINDPTLFLFILVVGFTYFVLFHNSALISQHEDKFKELSQRIAIGQLEQKKFNKDIITMIKEKEQSD